MTDQKQQIYQATSANQKLQFYSEIESMMRTQAPGFTSPPAASTTRNSNQPNTPRLYEQPENRRVERTESQVTF